MKASTRDSHQKNLWNAGSEEEFENLAPLTGDKERIFRLRSLVILHPLIAKDASVLELSECNDFFDSVKDKLNATSNKN